MGQPCFSTKRNRIIPVHCNSVDVISYGRINGWSWPWHPFQLIAWFFLLLFAVSHFGVVVFYVPREWTAAAAIIPASGYIIHIVYHFLATCIDPADPAVKSRGVLPKQMFDRSKNLHVIENLHCYICQASVGMRTKHCSVCNKCVSDFDHHCKWMNNCVGGQNYKLFLGSVLSALVTALVMFIIDLYLVIVYYSDQDQALSQSYFGNDRKWRMFVPVCKEAYIILTIVNGLLLLLAIGLLGHLLLFHGYLICHDMSTYEYIVNGRRKSARESREDLESQAGNSPPKMEPLSSTMHQADVTDTGHEPSISGSLSSRNSCGSYESRMFDNQERQGNSVRSSQEFPTKTLGAWRRSSPTTHVRSCDMLYAKSSTQFLACDGFELTKKRKCKKKRTRFSNMSSGSDAFEIAHDGRRSSVEATPSEDSRDDLEQALERYRIESDVCALDGFSSPQAGRASRPRRLAEADTDARGFSCSRNESSFSRPREPSPVVSPTPSRVSIMSFPKSSQQSTSEGGLKVDDEVEHDVTVVRSVSANELLNSSVSLGIGRGSACDPGAEGVITDRGMMVSPSMCLSSRLLMGSQELHAIPSSRRSTSSLPHPGSVNSSPFSSRCAAAALFESKQGAREIEAGRDFPTGHPCDDLVFSSVSPSQRASLDGVSLIGAPLDRSSTASSKGSERRPVQGYAATSESAIVPDYDEYDQKDRPASEEGRPRSAPKSHGMSEKFTFEEDLPGAADQSRYFGISPVSARSSPAEAAQPPSRPLSASSQTRLFGVLEETVLTGPLVPVQNVDGRNGSRWGRPRSTIRSCRSDSPGSEDELPVASVNEHIQAFALSDSLDRFRKLSDAFPVVLDPDIVKERSLLPPRLRSHESMAELTVVEFSRKKKAKRKVQGRSGSAAADGGLSTVLPRLPLDQLNEADAESLP